MDIPPSWFVRPREASYDLDNILLSSLSTTERDSGVHALFELDYLVIEGHARETNTLSPPRGLEVQLVAGSPAEHDAGNDVSNAIADTLVVANLGYHQFRAKPGVYKFEIRPGRGREIFALESVGSEGWESPSVDEAGDEITLMNFEGLVLYPRMARLPGMEYADVLAGDVPRHAEDDSIVGKLRSRYVQYYWRPVLKLTAGFPSFSSLFASKEDDTEKAVEPIKRTEQAEINIFTVASGLLYEVRHIHSCNYDNVH